jgi:uncharacterized membrane protein required for colicin V production
MAKAKSSKPLRLNPGQALLLMMLLGAMLVFMLPTVLIFVVGVLPTAVAVMTARGLGNYVGVTVGAMNLAGIVPVVILLWQGLNDLSSAIDYLTSPLAWLLILGGTVIGWLILRFVPAAVVRFMVHRSKGRLKQLRAKQEMMVKEWGDGVRVLGDEEAVSWKQNGTDS